MFATRSHEWPFTTEINIPPLSHKNILITLTETNCSRKTAIIWTILSDPRYYQVRMFTLTEHNAIISGRYRIRKTLTEEFSITDSSKSIPQCSSGGVTWKGGAIDLKTLWTWSWTFKLMIRLGLRINGNNQINLQITKCSKNRILKHFSIDRRNR